MTATNSDGGEEPHGRIRLTEFVASPACDASDAVECAGVSLADCYCGEPGVGVEFDRTRQEGGHLPAGRTGVGTVPVREAGYTPRRHAGSHQSVDVIRVTTGTDICERTRSSLLTPHPHPWRSPGSKRSASPPPEPPTSPNPRLFDWKTDPTARLSHPTKQTVSRQRRVTCRPSEDCKNSGWRRS